MTNSENSRYSEIEEKCFESGFEALTQEEAEDLFLCLLGSCTDPGELRKRLPGERAFSLFELSPDELKKRSLLESSVGIARAFPEIANRCIQTCGVIRKTPPRTSETSQEKALIAIIGSMFVGVKEERLLLVIFNEDKQLVSVDFNSVGTNNNTLIDQTQICVKACSEKARYIVLAHNHPGGTCFPSRADCESTAVLYDKLMSIGIILLDHYIVTRNQCMSLRRVFDYSNDDRNYRRTKLLELFGNAEAR